MPAASSPLLPTPRISLELESSGLGFYIIHTLLWGVQWLSLASIHALETKIFVIRGQKVMLDMHLAELYGVETKALKRAVKPSRDWFPGDLCFTLTDIKIAALRYRFGTSRWGGTRKLPMVFMEHGVAMLSAILKSPRAVSMSILTLRPL